MGAAIDSVLAQTYSDWELIAVDDGSSDGSSETVERLVAGEPRIRVVRRANGGLSAARNSALAVARGRFCALLDADDVWLPEKLEQQWPLLDDQTVVFSDAWIELDGSRFRYGARVGRPGGVYPRGEIFDELLRQNFIPSLTAVIPRPLLSECGGFDVGLRVSPDWDLWLRLSLGGIRFEYVPEPLAVYRVRHGSLSSDQEALRREAVAVVRRLCTRTSGPRREAAARRFRVARSELEVFLRKRAWASAAGGDTASARRDLLASLRSNPRSPRAIAGAMLAIGPPLLRWFARHQPAASFAGGFVRP